jgi:hypothetical protein
MMPLLQEVEELKKAYQSAPATLDRCERLVSSISGRLRTKQVSRALDALLKDEHERGSTHTLVNVQQSDLEDEIELAADFGYSRKDVKDYVRRVRQESQPAHRRPIVGTGDLVRELKALQAQAKEDMAKLSWEPKPWHLVRITKRARDLRRAREDAQYRLYCVTTIIADGMSSDLFDTSYAVGTSGLVYVIRNA